MTNSQNSSGLEPMNFDRSTEAKVCDDHGPYEAEFMKIGSRPVQVAGCKPCSEIRERERVAREREEAIVARRENFIRHMGNCGIPPRFQDRKLDNYVAETTGQKRALKIAQRLLETFSEPSSDGASLIFAGKPGTGKTHLACGIAIELLARRKTAVFMTSVQAVRYIRATYNRDSTMTETQAMDSLVDQDLLILDEVGAQHGSEHEKMIMFEVINERYQKRKSTILISNLTGDELTIFLGDRVMDRFRENGAVVAFDWASQRGKRGFSDAS